MGNSKKFFRKKQRNNNKASKYLKERQRNEKTKAAGAASVSEENKNYDSHDLEIMAALMLSISDTYTNPKCQGPHDLNSSHNLESWTTLGIPNSHGVFIPKTETHTGSDDQTTTPAPTKSCYSPDLEAMAALGVSIVRTHDFLEYDGPPVLNSAAYLESWAALGIPNSHGVFIPKPEIHTGSDDQTPPPTTPTESCCTPNLEAMAALGVSIVRTHDFLEYDGPPVLNSAANLESWAALGNPYIY